MNRNIIFSIFTVSLAIVFGSCHAQKTNATEAKSMKLSNEWAFQGFFNDGKLVVDQSKSIELTISPDEKFFTGNTGCNGMRGPIMVEANGKIKIGPVENGRKHCPNSEAEKKLLEALDCVTDYKIEGAILKLYCNEKSVMQFESYKN
ncbi:MAG: META domain-containing protein [Bacteroidia bacterium]